LIRMGFLFYLSIEMRSLASSAASLEVDIVAHLAGSGGAVVAHRMSPITRQTSSALCEVVRWL
jgi:hypothetical protein